MKAFFRIDGDETGYTYEAMILEYASQKWIVLTWLQGHTEEAPLPERLLPLASVRHSVEDRKIVLLDPLPKQFLNREAPLETFLGFGVIVHPRIAADSRGPSSIH